MSDIEMEVLNGFDISTVEEVARIEDEGRAVHLRDHNEKLMYHKGEGDDVLPTTWTVAGTNSSRYRKVEARQRQRKLKPKTLTFEQNYEDQLERIAHCTIRWDGINDKGTPIRCDVHNAMMILRRAPHIVEQLVEAMNDHSGFSSSSSPMPSST